MYSFFITVFIFQNPKFLNINSENVDNLYVTLIDTKLDKNNSGSVYLRS